MRYIPATQREREEMLSSIGVSQVSELFKEIPAHIKLDKELPLPRGLAEGELVRHMKNLSDKNVHLDKVVSFLGAGVYDHLIPSVVSHITSRGEFLTAYTPYQAEISQGVLQAIFEFQSLIAELTGMEAANASMYDGATALAEAALMACNVTRKNTVLLPQTLHPEWQDVVTLYLKSQDIKVIMVPFDQQTGTVPLKSYKEYREDIAGVVVAQPNFFGLLESAQEISDWAHELGALFIMAVDPISLGLLKSPGEYQADIVVGDGQPLGNPINFGGPGFGFFAVRGQKLIRRMPGRIVGQTVDSDEKRGFVLTLQTREQHIRREKATSNICSNQALNALAATVYMSVIGKEGLQEVANLCLQKAAYLRSKLEEAGFKLRFTAPFYREFVVEADLDWREVNQRLLDYGYLGGLPLASIDASLKNCVLLAATEARTKQEIDHFVKVLGGLSS